MPVHKIISTATRVQLWMDSSSPRSDFDIVQMLIDQGGDSPQAHAKIAAVIKQTMQDDIDVRILRSDFPLDDEVSDDGTDPAREDFFWEKVKGTWWVVSRSVIVKDVVWDGTVYVPTLRRAKVD